MPAEPPAPPSSSSPPNTSPTPSAAPGSSSSNGVRRHRSVRSLTRDYDSSITSSSTASSLAPPSPADGSAASGSSSAGGSPRRRSAHVTPDGSPRSPAANGTRGHTRRRSSVLLASATYPSTLQGDVPPLPRPRTCSGSSLSPDELRAVKSSIAGIASAAYPSSYAGSAASRSASPTSTKMPLPAPPPREPPASAPAAVSAASADQSTTTPVMKPRELPSLAVHIQAATPLSNSFSDVVGAGGDNAAAASREEEEEYEDLDTFDSSSPLPPLGQTGAANGVSEAALAAMTPAERREHSRKHSTVHARNLSVFFPRPGSEQEVEADRAAAAANFGRARGGSGTSAGASSSEDSLLPTPVESSNAGGLSPGRSRRGHHRRHSVIDSRTVESAAASSALAVGPSTPQKGLGVHGMNGSSTSLLSPHSPHIDPLSYFPPEGSPSSPLKPLTPVLGAKAFKSAKQERRVLSSLPRSDRPLMLFAAAHFALGAALWVAGQSGDSLAIGGLGYLVVFDALGELCEIGGRWVKDWHREAAAGEGKVYAPQRMETLLHFVQSIYLVFASIYVLKESIEHALLEGSDEVHIEDDAGLVLPTGLLLAATAFGVFSSVVLHNHAKLVAACGISTAASEAQSGRPRRGHGRSNSVLVDPTTLAGPFLHLLSNPFSLTVLFFTVALTFASIFMPPFQVAALDKVLAGLESAAMIYVAWPASKALGLVLLQTAPPTWQTQSVQLRHTMRTIEEHPLVTYVAPPHLWQLTPPTSAIIASSTGMLGGSLPASGARRGSNASGGGSTRAAKSAALVATMRVFLRADADDADVLDVTRWAWQLAAPALGAGAGLRAGESMRGSLRAGELVIECRREGVQEHYEKVHKVHHEPHACGHSHLHDHGGHSHDHGAHSHDHGAHSHDHGAHSHDHGAHSHDHGAHSHGHGGHSHDHASHGGHAHSHEAHAPAKKHEHAHDHAAHAHGSGHADGGHSHSHAEHSHSHAGHSHSHAGHSHSHAGHSHSHAGHSHRH